MKVVILAGGLGTRLLDENELVPKPMVTIGDRPILWHIMRSYAASGFNEFIVCLGFRGDVIKRFFLDYSQTAASAVTVRTGDGRVEVHGRREQDWTVHLVDTGLATATGGRVRRLREWLPDDEPFLLTYGDGVSDLDVNDLLRFHDEQRMLATVTAVRPPARFGGLEIQGDRVTSFSEKPQIGEGWINGGFMVMSSSVVDEIEGDDTVLESDVLEDLASRGELAAYRYDGFWQCMDTPRDRRLLEQLWESGSPPWMTR